MSSQPSQHSLQYGTTTIHYQLAFKERETLAIHVNPDTSVKVEAPFGSDLSLIEKKLRKRSAWILKQQKNFRLYSFEKFQVPIWTLMKILMEKINLFTVGEEQSWMFL